MARPWFGSRCRVWERKTLPAGDGQHGRGQVVRQHGLHPSELLDRERNQARAGAEVHHMPADAVLQLPENPAHRLGMLFHIPVVGTGPMFKQDLHALFLLQRTQQMPERRIQGGKLAHFSSSLAGQPMDFGKQGSLAVSPVSAGVSLPSFGLGRRKEYSSFATGGPGSEDRKSTRL